MSENHRDDASDQALRELLGRGTYGAPDDDLLGVAWTAGRGRARRRAWTTGAGAVAAGALAVGAAWSLGGGSAQTGPAPADSATATTAVDPASQDAVMVTSAGPAPEMAPYRVVFNVVEGESRPDGPVDAWDDLDGTTLQPEVFEVSTSEGTASAAYPGQLDLGGAWVFGADGTVVVPISCTEATYAADVRPDGTLVLREHVVEEAQRCSSPGGGVDPAWTMALMPTSHTGRAPTFVATWPTLTWTEGRVVATGTIDESMLFIPELTQEVPGEKLLLLSQAPQTELDEMPFVSGWDPESPPPGVRPQEAEGRWHLLDERGLAPVDGAPSLTFDGSSWTVTVCGQSRRAPGSLEDGRIRLSGDFQDAQATASAPCPDVPWQDLGAWESLLSAEPLLVRSEDGEALVLAGLYRP